MCRIGFSYHLTELTMRKVLIFLTAVVLVAARKYSSKHDKIDIDRLVQSSQYMQQSVGCYLDRNSCDKMTAMLKSKIPEIVQSACNNCTPGQKYILRRYLEELKTRLPHDYAAFRHKYDPDDVYFDELEATISLSRSF